MATVYIPTALRFLTNGAVRVEVAGGNVAQLVAALEHQFPGIAKHLTTDDQLARGLAVSIDGSFSSLGLRAIVREHSEVHFLPAIGGG